MKGIIVESHVTGKDDITMTKYKLILIQKPGYSVVRRDDAPHFN
jgi:hypothetical protein